MSARRKKAGERRDAKLWREYASCVDLYKFFIDAAIRIHVAHYAITGAILSYYFVHSPSRPLTRWSLALPAVTSVAFAAICAHGAVSMWKTRKSALTLVENLKLTTAPNFLLLAIGLSAFTIAHLATAIALGWMIWADPA